MIVSAILIVFAYLIGSISSAILICKVMGLPDPRTVGSKNPGTTNVLRIGGKLPALITLLGDVAKGMIPVMIAQLLSADALTLALVMLAAILGHLYPAYFKFQGGKGIATAIGCLLVLNPLSGSAFLLTWIATAILFRYSSVASMVALITAPIYLYFLSNIPSFYCSMAAVSVLLLYRHRSNITKLLAGKEDKIGYKR